MSFWLPRELVQDILEIMGNWWHYASQRHPILLLPFLPLLRLLIPKGRPYPKGLTSMDSYTNLFVGIRNPDNDATFPFGKNACFSTDITGRMLESCRRHGKGAWERELRAGQRLSEHHNGETAWTKNVKLLTLSRSHYQILLFLFERAPRGFKSENQNP